MKIFFIPTKFHSVFSVPLQSDLFPLGTRGNLKMGDRVEQTDMRGVRNMFCDVEVPSSYVLFFNNSIFLNV